jgi:ribosomal protein S18 acetylase RimI-like enzyme
VEETGFFSTEEVGVAVELVEVALAQGDAGGYRFLLAESEEGLVGYTCYGPIPATQGSYDLYWIAVSPTRQGSGVGTALLLETERLIREQGGRMIYIETSSREQYRSTRAFYRARGYAEEAVLKDFYRAGDSKVILSKHLAPAATVDV